MSEFGRVLRLEARRTALLVAVPLLTAVGAAVAWVSLAPVAYWDNSVIALMNSVRLLGPLAAGLAAWTAVRERRLDYLRDLTPRSPATGAFMDMLLLSGAALIAYAAVSAVVVIGTFLRDEAGPLHLTGVLAGAAALVMHVVAGYLAGRLVPRLATVVVVVVATWLWSALRVPATSWVSLLPPAALNRVELFTGLRVGVLLSQTLWSAGLTAAMILAYAWWTTRRHLLAAALAAALALVVFATLRLESTGGQAVGPVAIDSACREWPITVCVHPALRDGLPALMNAATPLAARLNDTPGAFTKVEQRPDTSEATLVHGVASIHLRDLEPGYEADAVRQIRNELVDPGACSVPKPAAAQYRSLIDAWLVGAEPPAISDLRAARAFGLWTEEQRRGWLRVHYRDYHRCALNARDFARPSP
ncbi:hypothetical protein J4573_13530 [Actinomadura barringtoniae]|uniref:Uncharacterized protein n=1 Tax=Actinomadura barringtoniae TaxID=1427535 RepID=A0A939T4F1_9ACTN|nr:hypothetical protein [Actinomadura barringtoniae]MBO2448119.1 hypothetical protein [Actinomadura barringtoniae]